MQVTLPPYAFAALLRMGQPALAAAVAGTGVQQPTLSPAHAAVTLKGTKAAIAQAEAQLLTSLAQSVSSAGSSSMPAGTAGVGTDLEPTGDGDGAQTDGENQEAACCPVCFCPTEDPYPLALCGHAYCRACVLPLLTTAISSNALPVQCCAQGCTAAVSLRDFGALLMSDQVRVFGE